MMKINLQSCRMLNNEEFLLGQQDDRTIKSLLWVVRRTKEERVILLTKLRPQDEESF